jgi:GTP cyclohydrolase I
MPHDSSLTWLDVFKATDELRDRIDRRKFRYIYGVPTGGCFVALDLCHSMGLELLDEVDSGGEMQFVIVVDDIVDSGKTLRQYADRFHVDAVYRKHHSPADLAPEAKVVDGFVKFPWEHAYGAEDSVIRLIEFVGEDPSRSGLTDTPKRVLSAWQELCRGYKQNPADILKRTFDEKIDEMIIVRNIEFHSMCEHHLLPFVGSASIGYIPSQNGSVVGISKLARLVECFAARLQIQERLTNQIAEAIMHHLNALGCGVIIKAKHSCMACRGVRKSEAEAVTSSLRGAFRTNESARMEFLSLIE